MRSFDLDAVKIGQEVLLFCEVGADLTGCLARPAWVDEPGNPGTRVVRWQSTWDGATIPAHWTPYAWESIDPPDPAAAEQPEII